MAKPKRYPDNWREIAFSVKENARWCCAKCDRQCLRPGDNTKDLTKSERLKLTLTVHHHNRIPEDNRKESREFLERQKKAAVKVQHQQ